MRWLGRLGVALLGLALLFAAAVCFGPDLARRRVAGAVGRALHRDVTIGHLALLAAWPPTIQARDVAVPGLGEAARVEARIALPSLLLGAPAVEQVTLVRPILRLAPDAQGRVFVLPPPAAPARAEAPGAPGGGSAQRAPLPRIVIEDGTLEWRDKRIGPPLIAAVSGAVQGGAYDLTLHGRVPAGTAYPLLTGAEVTARVAAGQSVRATIAVPWRAATVQAQIQTDTPEAITAGGPLPLTITANVAGAALRGTGTIAGTAASPRFDMAVSLQDADARALAALIGWRQAAPGPVSLTARVVGSPAAIVLQGLALRSPQGDVSGDLALALGVRPGLRGALRSERLDLDAVLAALLRPAVPVPAAPLATAAAAPVPAPASRTLIPDRALPLAWLARADADLTLQAAALRLGGVEYQALSGHLLLLGGSLTLAPFAATLPGAGRLDASVQLRAGAAGLVLHAPAVAVAPLLAAWRLPDLASGTAALDLNLNATGATPHALAASLDGTATLRLTDATLDGGLASLLLRAARLPAALAGQQVALRCAAVGAKATTGVLALAPLVADADRLRIDGAGSVDLGQETMALQLLPTLRSGPGLVIPVLVSGPWRTPKVQLGAGPLTTPAVDFDSCPASPLPASAPQPGRKHPKGIDILRSLLR